MNPADEDCEEKFAKPFSIRQYTLSCRQKNIFDCWPFPDKFLLLCQKHGVTNVLPPIVNPSRSVIQSSEHDHSINFMQKDNKDPIIVIQSAAKESNKYKKFFSNHISSDMLGSQMTTTTSQLCLDVDKQPIRSVDCSRPRPSWKNDRRRKAKQKKRLMVDILAVAKPCSLQDVHEMDSENADICTAPVRKGSRSVKQAAIVLENGCNSELAEDHCSNQKLEIHGYEEEYPNLSAQNRWVLKGQIHRLQIQV